MTATTPIRAGDPRRAETVAPVFTRAQARALLAYGREARVLLELTPGLDPHHRRQALAALAVLGQALNADPTKAVTPKPATESQAA